MVISGSSSGVQVPLIELTSVQFLLMSATLGGLLDPYVRQPPLAERRDAGEGGGGGGEDLQVAGPVRTLANDLYVSVSTLRARRAESELVRRPTGRAVRGLARRACPFQPDVPSPPAGVGTGEGAASLFTAALPDTAEHMKKPAQGLSQSL